MPIPPSKGVVLPGKRTDPNREGEAPIRLSSPKSAEPNRSNGLRLGGSLALPASRSRRASGLKVILLLLPAIGLISARASAAGQIERVRVADDGRGFVLARSGAAFTPWGFNYERTDLLIEDYWDSDWPGVEKDFRDMRALGANVARIHLQLAKFMDGPDRPNCPALEKLARLLKLGEQTGLYLDLTGLACYRPADVPKWYDPLTEHDRWAVQARFWEAVANVASSSDAVFCYDLMNEPIVAGGKRDKWYSGTLLGGFDFVQFIAIDQAGRPREQIARDWIRTLAPAIRKYDRSHLITVGLLPWVPKWGHLSGFVPATVAPELDFISVHIYPAAGKQDEAMTTLKQFVAGKPIVIEETFPLSCSVDELRQFLLASRGIACGWIGHYFGQTIEQLQQRQQSKQITIGQAMTLEWLNLFKEIKPQMVGDRWP